MPLSFIPPLRCLISGGTKYEGKQAQIRLRLPVSSPETPSKPILFRNAKISALISPRLPKYGCNGLEKRRSPRPFKSRLVFFRGFACFRRDLPCKGSLARSFFTGSGKIGYITRYLSSTGVGFDEQWGFLHSPNKKFILPIASGFTAQIRSGTPLLAPSFRTVHPCPVPRSPVW